MYFLFWFWFFCFNCLFFRTKAKWKIKIYKIKTEKIIKSKSNALGALIFSLINCTLLEMTTATAAACCCCCYCCIIVLFRIQKWTKTIYKFILIIFILSSFASCFSLLCFLYLFVCLVFLSLNEYSAKAVLIFWVWSLIHTIEWKIISFSVASVHLD